LALPLFGASAAPDLHPWRASADFRQFCAPRKISAASVNFAEIRRKRFLLIFINQLYIS